MTVPFVDQRKACSAGQLSSFANTIGKSLPPDYVRFLARQNGGRPEANRLEVRGVGGVAIATFLGVDEVISAKELLGTRIDHETWPIAADESGNYVGLAFTAKGWKVVLWDHETNREHSVAKSFDEFLELLEPDSETVELAPGQVISAWVHPSLRKFQKK